jgi:hypothetical protein
VSDTVWETRTFRTPFVGKARATMNASSATTLEGG